MVQSWFNADGLYVRFGPDASGPTTGGEYLTYGELRELEYRIDLTTLTSTSAIIDDITFLPKGVFVEQVELVMQTAGTSGGTPTLDVGYIQSSDRSTVISNTAFISAQAFTGTLDTLGKKVTYNVGTTSAGSVVGTTTSSTQVGQLSARANSGTFTAGVAIVRIKYRRVTAS